MKPSKLSSYKSWLTSAAIAAAIALWLMTGRASRDEEQAPAAAAADAGKKSLTSVRIREQVAEDVTRVVRVNGRTAPARTVEINAETDGRVVAVGIERGERMATGDVIVHLDERDRVARLAQAKATVKQRELEFDARSKLRNDSYVSEAQLQEAAALLEAARAELARAELDIEHVVIRAPFDGALQDRMVEVGDYVKAGDPVARYVDDRELIVSADVSEFDAHYLAKGGEGSATLATGEQVSGRIRYVAPVADESTRTFRVELEVDNAAGAYRGGMTATLLIPAETILAHKVSPSLLTLDDDGNIGIKIVNDEGRVEFYPADIAMSSNEGVWVAGLPQSAAIITVGQGFVNAGSPVEAVPEMEIDSAVAIKTAKRDD